ncbi:MAG: hydroxymethylpyrimidine/phosphomethylpyrimidine kinase, partial [Sulfurovum sp.]|nr:hydroxymethylpyrimidine/phosphomethylpyrimidine kinase [Sulfurovum sp.]
MKVVLSIAGSDSSGGAGIQADLKTFEAFGVFGTTAITVLTAQNTTGVEQIVPMEASFVKKQIDMVFKDFDVAAIKIGMLFNKDIIETVAQAIKGLDIPIVLDPVSISKAGSPLLEDDAVKAMHTLFDDVTLITPNHHEAYEFFGYKNEDTKTHKIIQDLNTPVLVKHHVIELADEKFSVD